MESDPTRETETGEPDFRSPVGRLLRPRTPTETRVSGLVGLVVGAVLFGLGAVLSSLARVTIGSKSVTVVGGFTLTGYVCMMTGLYRLVTGKTREQARQGILWSLFRIFFGVVFLVAGVVLMLLAMAWASRPSN